MNRFVGPFLSAVLCCAATFSGATVPFDGRWEELRFSLFASNEFLQRGSAVDVASDGTVSLLWRKVPGYDRDAALASWTWEVTESVPPTDLTLKGGDDRNLSLYFVFMPVDLVAEAEKQDIRWMLKQSAVRVLMYTWGGLDREKGHITASPYMNNQGATFHVRPAGTGKYDEAVDLRADYARAFGGDAGALVGVAISADSDDTKTHVRATLSDLVLTGPENSPVN